MVRLNLTSSEASRAILHLMLWSDFEKLGGFCSETLAGVAQGVSLMKGAARGRFREIGR